MGDFAIQRRMKASIIGGVLAAGLTRYSIKEIRWQKIFFNLVTALTLLMGVT